MEKKPLIIGNWKMELSYRSSLEIAGAIRKLLSSVDFNGQVVICPSTLALPEVADLFKNSTKLGVGAQNVHWEEKGAWTGETSVMQIKPFASWCIVGHSERRALAGETDEQVRRKIELLLKHEITPVVCIGETIEERNQGQSIKKVTGQISTILEGLHRSSLPQIVIAYEPIWAIGTGEMPNPDDVSEIMLLMRKIISEKYDANIADRIRFLYGGSVKPNNVSDYDTQPGVDGVLVGGASVHPMQFADIVKAIAVDSTQ